MTSYPPPSPAAARGARAATAAASLKQRAAILTRTIRLNKYLRPGERVTRVLQGRSQSERGQPTCLTRLDERKQRGHTSKRRHSSVKCYMLVGSDAETNASIHSRGCSRELFAKPDGSVGQLAEERENGVLSIPSGGAVGERWPALQHCSSLGLASVFGGKWLKC